MRNRYQKGILGRIKMINFAQISKKGDRSYNEDTVRVETNGDTACFVLADGLGGHGGGADASRIVADDVIEQFREKGKTESFLSDCFEHAQHQLLEYQKDQRIPE